MDRVIIKNNEVIIIDYKSGEQPSSKWKEQLKNYKKVLSEYFPDKDIETYIINLNTGEVLENG